MASPFLAIHFILYRIDLIFRQSNKMDLEVTGWSPENIIFPFIGNLLQHCKLSKGCLF